ncbi:MAG: glycosyltransferase family 1 protein [Betaproteobacteria bacterium]
MNETVAPFNELAAERRLRIAVVTETYPPEVNGVAMTTGRLVDGLLRRGHYVHLVRPKQNARDRPRNNQRAEETLVASVPLPRYQGLRIGLPASRRLLRLWRDSRPDVVNVVTEGPLGRSALIAARRLHIPACSEFHTNFHSYSHHYGFGVIGKAIERYLKRFHNAGACTFVPTQELKVQLERQGYRNLSVVARGADTHLFAPARRSDRLRASWGAGENDVVAIYVGRLAPEKNLPLVLSAFDAIRTGQPSARLVLVGDGPQRKQLQAAHPDYHFAGMRHGEDLAAHYASADVFLFPSLTETFGNVTVEALASGLAVVAYDYAAAREHIRHGGSGVLADYDDFHSFIALAVQVANDPALCAHLRVEARRAAERIDWERVVHDLEIALLAVVNRQESAHA